MIYEKNFIIYFLRIFILKSSLYNIYYIYLWILWKNQTDLEIEKNKAGVLNAKSIKISFENNNNFYKRENRKFQL